MHFDQLSDLAQGQRLQLADPVLEKPLLQAHDFGGDADDGAGALIKRLQQPVGAGHAFIQEAMGGLVRSAGKFAVIVAIDDQARQRRLVQADLPAAVRAARHEHIRHHRRAGFPAITQAGLGIIGFQFADHVHDILAVQFAQTHQAGHVAARHQIEIVEQLFHRRVAAIGSAGLGNQAFR